MSLRAPLLALALLTALPARAELEGTQRLSALLGWRYTPNQTFHQSAAISGFELAAPSLGGPFGSIGFGYSFADWAELAVNGYVGAETIRFVGAPPLQSITYGAAVGVRLQLQTTFLGMEVIPALGIFTGPAFIYVSGPPVFPHTEALTDSYAATVGATFKTSPAFGFTVEAKLLLARGFVPGVGTANGGGLWVGVGAAWVLGQIPPEARGTLD